MKKVKRAYTGKTVEMLTVISVLAKFFILHKKELQAKRSNYADPYFEDLQARIDKITEHYLGKNNGKALGDATALVTRLQREAIADLSDFKLQIEEDFKDNKEFVAETFRTLGFQEHFAGVKNRSQLSLVSLLFAFKRNLSEDLKYTIVQKGTSEELLNGIAAKASELYLANVQQEKLKEEKKSASKESNTVFNDIYKEVITIAKYAVRFVKEEGAGKDKFSYAKHLQMLTGEASAATVKKKARAAVASAPTETPLPTLVS